MDKNFIIAILLTIAIIFIYSSPWYQKNYGRELPPKTTVESTKSDSSFVPAPTRPPVETTVKQDTTPKKEVPAQETPVISQINVPYEKNITLENEDIRVTFSTRSGAIVKATMNGFDGLSDNEPVQLVSEGQTWCTGEIRDLDNIISFSDIVFDIADYSKDHITFTAELTTNSRIIREYTLEPDGFLLRTTTTLEGEWNDPEILFTWNGPLNNTEAPVRQLRIWPFTMFMRDETTLYNKIAYLGQGDRTTIEDNGKEKFKRIYSKEGAQKHILKKNTGSQHILDGDLDWFAVRNKYFMSAAIPLKKTRWKAASIAGVYNGRKWFDFTISKRVSDGDTSLSIYLGPISYDLLKSYNYNLTEVMELSWRFIRPLSIAFLWIIKKMYKIIPNWGIVIILFSIFIKIVLYPLSKKSIESMRKMSALQPQITEMKSKYKNNPQKQHTAMMELYKKEGINPMGGCFPMLFQLPVFFALYPVIGKAFEIRQAMFIPHWIEDLSRPDPYFILPVAMGLSMFFQSKATMKDPNQKAMLYVMPVMMVILFANFSSGLTLYWFMFNIMTLIQQNLVKTHQ